jgi:hypothetical protein
MRAEAAEASVRRHKTVGERGRKENDSGTTTLGHARIFEDNTEY